MRSQRGPRRTEESICVTIGLADGEPIASIDVVVVSPCVRSREEVLNTMQLPVQFNCHHRGPEIKKNCTSLRIISIAASAVAGIILPSVNPSDKRPSTSGHSKTPDVALLPMNTIGDPVPCQNSMGHVSWAQRRSQAARWYSLITPSGFDDVVPGCLGGRAVPLDQELKFRKAMLKLGYALPGQPTS